VLECFLYNYGQKVFTVRGVAACGTFVTAVVAYKVLGVGVNAYKKHSAQRESRDSDRKQ